MHTENQPITVGVDGSEGTSRTLAWAAAEATRLGAPVRLVHAVAVPGVYSDVPLPAELLDEFKRDGEQVVRDAAGELARIAPDIQVDTYVRIANPAALLLERPPSARMIVLGAGERTHGFFTGSTAVAVAAHAHCPVAVVRPGAAPLPEQGPVVVGVDGSRISESAIDAAFQEASSRGAPLIALHTFGDAEAQRQLIGRMSAEWEKVADVEERALGESLARWQDKYPDVQVRRLVRRGRPRHRLLELAEDAQLVVVGSRGRGGFTGMLLGSTSQALIHHSPCPVLVIRPPRQED